MQSTYLGILASQGYVGTALRLVACQKPRLCFTDLLFSPHHAAYLGM